MQIWHGDSPQLATRTPHVVTFGTFDGVHLGHQQILATAVEAGRKVGLPVVAMTFDPHPATLHRPEAQIRLLSSLKQRLEALAEAGVDATWVVPYTWELANHTAEEFVAEYLHGRLHAQVIVVGADARFGRGNTGDVSLLQGLGDKFGFRVEVVPDSRGPGGRRYSSTWVREALAAGDIETAAAVLGYWPRVYGEVVHGCKRGRELGFPTANLRGRDLEVIPADGVYAGWLVRSGIDDFAGAGNCIEKWREPAAISVGSNPQFSGDETTVEAHVLGRADLNLYGEVVAVEFVRRLRGMEKFSTLSQLQTQMDADLLAVAAVLGVAPARRLDPAAVTAH